MTTDNPHREAYTPVSAHRSKPLRDYSDSPLHRVGSAGGQLNEMLKERERDEKYEQHRPLIEARAQDEALARSCQDAKEAARIMHEAINALPPSTERDLARESMVRVESYLRAVIYAIDPNGQV